MAVWNFHWYAYNTIPATRLHGNQIIMKELYIPLLWVGMAFAGLAQTPCCTLPAKDAGITGGAQYYAEGDFIGSWTDPNAKLQWDVTLDEAASGRVELTYAVAPGHGGQFVLEVAGQKLAGKTESTGGWYDYRTMSLGTVTLAKGNHLVTLSAGPFATVPMNVREIRLIGLKGSTKRLVLPLPPTFVVPNFHPASCGWLTDWSTERIYCANSYLDHLDRVRDDANYGFVLSECNNMIAILNFAPDRFAEIKQRIKEGRVEAVNAFFLEPTVNLSGGEALAKMGIEGLRWQERMLGVRPRYCWSIDTCGIHDQMPQIVRLLGLDALVYTRGNRAGTTTFWSDSPDGSRILTIVPGHYSDFDTVMGATAKLTDPDLLAVERSIAARARVTPAGVPALFFGGRGDYALAPPGHEEPSEFLEQWKAYRPDVPMKFTTLSQWMDAFDPRKLDLPVVRAGTGYTFDSFWIENPRVKTSYRRCEHALQAAETLATIASLKTNFDYPAQTLYHAWLQMLLNMDRNTLWGSAGGMVFEDEASWDVKDRFDWVEKHSAEIADAALRKLGIARPTPPAESPKPIALPETIETAFYSARVDAATGALVSLKLKPSGREMLGGPANVLVLEKRTGPGEPGDFCDPRPNRPRLGSSSEHKPVITVTESDTAITVEAQSDFHGARRVMRFSKTNPRIDCTTEVKDLPDLSVLVAEFPMAAPPTEIRRGIPFGFSRDDNHVSGIVPAVRYSDYSTTGKGGIALLDRGLSGREINHNVPIIYLYNATDKYYGYFNSWLSGKGEHKFEYALLAHDADWDAARIPQQAWAYNGAPLPSLSSFLNTSDNVIVEAMRRDGPDIELRLVECLGLAGNAEVTLNLPHESAAMTNLVGGHAQVLEGGPSYKFPVRPQQIVTLRFRTAKPAAEIEPLTDWTPLVPEMKRPALNRYLKDVKGHPPRGN